VPKVSITKSGFLSDRQGKTFADVVADPQQPFDEIVKFFNNEERQQRMEDAELHHDRAPLAGVVRELESMPTIDEFLAGAQVRRNTRFRQAVGVLVRIIMEQRGWRKTGRKGSLGVRAAQSARSAAHNTGGLAFWFIRAERYERTTGMPFKSVQARCAEFDSTARQSPKEKIARRSRS
jgi:hypothetical protein